MEKNDPKKFTRICQILLYCVVTWNNMFSNIWTNEPHRHSSFLFHNIGNNRTELILVQSWKTSIFGLKTLIASSCKKWKKIGFTTDFTSYTNVVRKRIVKKFTLILNWTPTHSQICAYHITCVLVMITCTTDVDFDTTVFAYQIGQVMLQIPVTLVDC